jgi:hypothetical protein
MISGKVDGIDIQVEIIEAKNKESFEKKINESIVKGGKPIFETFNVTNVPGISIKGTAAIKEKYSLLVAYDIK